MDPVHREILRKERLQLSEQVLVSDTVVQYLYQEDVLTQSHVEDIQSKPSNKAKTLRLLDILPARGPHAFHAFLGSLEEEFAWVRNLLLQKLDSQHAVGQCSQEDDCHIPNAILCRVPSDRELSRLAMRLGLEWESVLLDLGLSADALFRCRVDYPHSTHGQVLAGLLQWRRSKGKAATVERLLHSLRATDIHHSILEDVLQ